MKKWCRFADIKTSIGNEIFKMISFIFARILMDYLIKIRVHILRNLLFKLVLISFNFYMSHLCYVSFCNNIGDKILTIYISKMCINVSSNLCFGTVLKKHAIICMLNRIWTIMKRIQFANLDKILSQFASIEWLINYYWRSLIL